MRFDSGDVGDLGDLLGGLFNRGGGGGGSGRRRQPTKGADLVTDVYLSFEDAAHGLTTGVQLSNEAPCPDCAASSGQRHPATGVSRLRRHRRHPGEPRSFRVQPALRLL